MLAFFPSPLPPLLLLWLSSSSLAKKNAPSRMSRHGPSVLPVLAWILNRFGSHPGIGSAGVVMRTRLISTASPKSTASQSKKALPPPSPSSYVNDDGDIEVDNESDSASAAAADADADGMLRAS
jgi:hypothetical protein